MTTAQLKQQLHDYIDHAEEIKLKAIYTLVEDEIEDNYSLTEEQKEELDRRYNDYKNGVGSQYTWDEVIKLSDKALVEKTKQ